MGDKGKGKNTGKVKTKPKAAKKGLRPHEQRHEDALKKASPE